MRAVVVCALLLAGAGAVPAAVTFPGPGSTTTSACGAPGTCGARCMDVTHAIEWCHRDGECRPYHSDCTSGHYPTVDLYPHDLNQTTPCAGCCENIALDALAQRDQQLRDVLDNTPGLRDFAIKGAHWMLRDR